MLASQKDYIWSSASAACVFVKYSQNIKGQPHLSVENIIESGAFMTMDTVPKNQRFY
jgi:hypothetical protein